MGAQWKHSGRVENANKRGAVIGKLVKEIIVSVKGGDSNPDNNSRLRAALEAARKASVPRDTIERAIKKGSGQGADAAAFESVYYEGFAPHKVPVIIECLTDNKNRTAADMRVLFRKGQLGSAGSVAWMFDRMGVIEATIPISGADIEAAAIETGAQNVEALESAEIPPGSTGGRFICDPTDLDSVNKALTKMNWVITKSELSYLAKNNVEVAGDAQKEVIEFLTAIDDNDDVHRIYTAIA